MAVLEPRRAAEHEQRQRRGSPRLRRQLALGAVQRLFNAAGGRALFPDSPMQREMRDLYAVAAHRGLAWEASSPVWRLLLGGRA